VPRNVGVVSQTATTITLSWDAPLDLGGRDDLSYEICHQLTDCVHQQWPM
jgi:hypothetical protein